MSIKVKIKKKSSVHFLLICLNCDTRKSFVVVLYFFQIEILGGGGGKEGIKISQHFIGNTFIITFIIIGLWTPDTRLLRHYCLRTCKPFVGFEVQPYSYTQPHDYTSFFIVNKFQ